MHIFIWIYMHMSIYVYINICKYVVKGLYICIFTRLMAPPSLHCVVNLLFSKNVSASISCVAWSALPHFPKFPFLLSVGVKSWLIHVGPQDFFFRRKKPPPSFFLPSRMPRSLCFHPKVPLPSCEYNILIYAHNILIYALGEGPSLEI